MKKIFFLILFLPLVLFSQVYRGNTPISGGSSNVIIDEALSEISTNPLQNSVIYNNFLLYARLTDIANFTSRNVAETINAPWRFLGSLSTETSLFLDIDNNGVGGILFFPSVNGGINNGNLQPRIFAHDDKLAFRNSTQSGSEGALLIEQNNTGQHTVLFPDKSGTVAFTDDIVSSGTSYIEPSITFQPRESNQAVTNEWAAPVGETQIWNTNSSSNDYIYSIGNLFSSFQKVRVKQFGSGTMTFIADPSYSIVAKSGSTLVDTSTTNHDGVTINHLDTAIFYRVFNTIYFDGVVQPYVNPIDNLFDLSNSADPESEVDGINGVVGSGNILETSTTEQASNGLYSIKHEVASSGTNLHSRYNLNSITVSTPTIIDVDVFVTQGTWTVNLASFGGWTANVSEPINSTGQWVTIRISGTTHASTSPTLRFQNASANSGDTIYTDNIVVTQ